MKRQPDGWRFFVSHRCISPKKKSAVKACTIKKNNYFCPQMLPQMMKKLGRMFTALLLSLAVVYVSAGVTLVRCLHSDFVAVSLLAEETSADDCCQEEADDSRHQKEDTSCMEVSVEQLQPSDVQEQVHLPSPVILALLPKLTQWLTHCISIPDELTLHCKSYLTDFISPPQVYLDKLCTLII